MPLDLNDPGSLAEKTKTWASAFETIGVCALLCATLAFIVYVLAT